MLQFASAPLIAFLAANETNYENETDGREFWPGAVRFALMSKQVASDLGDGSWVSAGDAIREIEATMHNKLALPMEWPPRQPVHQLKHLTRDSASLQTAAKYFNGILLDRAMSLGEANVCNEDCTGSILNHQ